MTKKKQSYWVTVLLIGVLLLFTFLTGYNYFKRPILRELLAEIETQRALQEQQEEASSQSEDLVSEALAAFSTEQKIYQLIAMPVTLGDAEKPPNLAWLRQKNPGYVTLFGNNISHLETQEFITAIQTSPPTTLLGTEEKQIVPLVAVDHEGGTVQRLSGDGFTLLPAWSELCEYDQVDREGLLASSAAELKDAGVNLVFAPVLDINFGDSFLRTRACRNEARAIAAARSYILEFGKQQIFSVTKHFPGLGTVVQDIHFSEATVAPSQSDTRPFELMLQTFPNIGLMTTHVQVEGATDGVPCSLSDVCLKEFPEFFPQTILFSDALEMESALQYGEAQLTLREEDTLSVTSEKSPSALSLVAHRALLAGNHVLVFGENVSQQEIQELVGYLTARAENDRHFLGVIEQAARKTMTLKLGEESTIPEEAL